ncbi:MAG: hypothetical protein Q7S33_01770 [Nanoarchaeota archaeon]|nr:hypothetical protein [Nanoarchaeota archaeon]
MNEKLNQFYDKNYKKILIIPILFMILSLAYIFYFYNQNGDIIQKDVSLTGGTTISVFTDKSVVDLQSYLINDFPDLIVTSVEDNSGKQIKIIIIVPDAPEKITPVLEKYFGYKFTEDNSSTEFTGSSLSKDFYNQLKTAIIFAFLLMALVVFLIFSKGTKTKLTVIGLNLIVFIFLFLQANAIFLILAVVLMIFIFYLYIKNSIPSVAVVFAAFADIIMTLAVVNLLGMKVSSAGIVAFLMLIGYSVDTDILLTTRVLRRGNSSVNEAVFGAVKTGLTMTLTSLIAVSVALFFVYSFESILNQIFSILAIGLFFDIFNTWLTNASMIKWYVEAKAQ